MALSWSARRQFLYYVVASIVFVIIVAAIWKVFFTSTPTCSDGVRNGTELGVDCGGACQLVCRETARSPRILWARSFQTDTSTYTAAAYIENSNKGAGAHGVRYTFQLFDENNVLVVQRDGVIDIPPTTLVPVIETNLNVGQRTPVRTLFSFADTQTWTTATTPKLDLHLTGQALEPDGSRLSATLNNNSLEDAKRVSVIAVLFDDAGIARAASKTILNVSRKSSQPVVFTWPQGIPGVVRAEMTILPSF